MKRGLLASVALSALAGIASAQIPAGDAFLVNTYTTGHQRQPRIAVAADGDFIIVWSSADQDGSGWGVFGQRFGATGTPRGLEWQINATALADQGPPVVVAGPKGDFVVAWFDRGIAPSPGIQARRYDASGNPIGAEFNVNANGGGDPEIARADDGRFVVVWSSYIDGSSSGIAAQPFDAAGNPSGPRLVVNTYTTGEQTTPDVAGDAMGNFIVVWEDRAPNRDGSASGIFGRRFNSLGSPIGGEFQVNTYTSGNQERPSVSMSPVGGFVVAWASASDNDAIGVNARRFDAVGNPIGTEFLVNTGTLGHEHVGSDAIAHDASGNFVIVWAGGPSPIQTPFGQLFDAAGNRRGNEIALRPDSLSMPQWPAVSSDAAGNFVVTWADYKADGSYTGILARRFQRNDGDLIFEDGFDSGALGP